MKHLNADFSKRVVVHGAELEWQDSPMAGVSRRMLDRIGDEIARATTLVRYDPDSHFSPHVHTGGEEFIVLEGVFQDEHGDFPTGSYIRNPPQSKHTPGSEPGCVIFVKLWQFDLDDRTQLRTDINKIDAVPDPTRPGVTVTPLFQDERELVRVEQWQPGAALTLDTSGSRYPLHDRPRTRSVCRAVLQQSRRLVYIRRSSDHSPECPQGGSHPHFEIHAPNATGRAAV